MVNDFAGVHSVRELESAVTVFGITDLGNEDKCMFQEINVRRLSAGSIYKIVWFGTVFSFVPFGFVMGVCALFGANTVHWNKAPITGAMGLLLGPFLGLFIAVVFTVIFGTVCALGMWVFSMKYSFKLRFVPSLETMKYALSEAENEEAMQSEKPVRKDEG